MIPRDAQTLSGLRARSSETEAAVDVLEFTTRVPEHPSDGNRKVPVRPDREKLSTTVQCVTTPLGWSAEPVHVPASQDGAAVRPGAGRPPAMM